MTLEPLWIPNFIPNFRKIVGVFFEISCDGWTDERTDDTDFIDHSVFNRGPKKADVSFEGL